MGFGGVSGTSTSTLPRINSGEFDPRDLASDVDSLSEDLAVAALRELPDEEFYGNSDDESISEQTPSDTRKRSWLGKVGKGLYRRAVGGKKTATNGDGRTDSDVQALVLACRSPMACETGGVACHSAEDMRVCRSVLSLMVKQMGRNLLTGGNVMNVSFPIQCCQPKTTLEIGAAVSPHATVRHMSVSISSP